MRICDIAFDAFFKDTRNLVTLGVREDVTCRTNKASSQDERSEALDRGRLREAFLKSWLKMKFPLGYGVDRSHDTFDALVEAVAPDALSVRHGLPHCTENEITPHEFINSLIEMSRPEKPSAPRAPVVLTGSFLPVLKIAHVALLNLVKDRADAAQQEFLMDTFWRAVKIFHINFFPSSKQNEPGTRGSPFRKPLFDSWGSLSKKDKRRPRLVLGPSVASSSSMPPATVAFNKAIANDCNADWHANSLDLTTLPDFIKKTSLPVDFTTPNPISKAYVDDTYQWVKDNYDGTNPLHHLALLVAIIVASSIRPYLFLPPNASTLFPKSHSREDVRSTYQSLDWVKKDKKGMKEISVFIGMFTSFIIAVYEDESPLMKHIIDSKKGGLGEKWTNKHCQHFLVFLPFPSDHSFLFQLQKVLPIPTSSVSICSRVRGQVQLRREHSARVGVATTPGIFDIYIKPFTGSSPTRTISLPLSTYSRF